MRALIRTRNLPPEHYITYSDATGLVLGLRFRTTIKAKLVSQPAGVGVGQLAVEVIHQVPQPTCISSSHPPLFYFTSSRLLHQFIVTGRDYPLRENPDYIVRWHLHVRLPSFLSFFFFHFFLYLLVFEPNFPFSRGPSPLRERRSW